MPATVTELNAMKRTEIEKIMLTPELATKLLEHNEYNRPVSDAHVARIARQIVEGKWQFNGDTIKVASNGDVLDGQHRCWAVIEAKRAVETIIVRGVEREAFATVDTIRKVRSGADILALAGLKRHKNIVSAAYKWLLIWQRAGGDMTKYRKPEYWIENSDIEAAYAAHPHMVDAAEKMRHLRSIAAPSILTFSYYVFASRNQGIAERFHSTLDAPAGMPASDPFYKLRALLLSDTRSRRADVVNTMAVIFKAANVAKEGKRIERLFWKGQGEKAEEFPKLRI